MRESGVEKWFSEKIDKIYQGFRPKREARFLARKLYDGFSYFVGIFLVPVLALLFLCELIVNFIADFADIVGSRHKTAKQSQNLVFTCDFVQRTQMRYEAKPEHNRPGLYFVAVHERGRAIREKIERWASQVPSKILNQLLPRLQHPDQHRHACGELLTCYHLCELGYQVEYERGANRFESRFLGESPRHFRVHRRGFHA